jgi:hypothetical protein
MKTTKIKPKSLYWASWNHFEFRIPGQAIIDICHSGPNDSDVAKWKDKILEQITKDDFANKPTKENIIKEIKEYGSWEDDELQNESDNWDRLIWLAAWNIFEEEKPDCSKPIKNSAKQ